MNLFRRALGGLPDAAWLRRQFTEDADVVHDVKHGARMLLKSPSFALSAVLILAIGIGGTVSISTLLDTAMGHACLARLAPGETFLTADLHVDFYRAATPGSLRAEAEVRHQSRRAMFCEASLYDAEGLLLAAGRCTQIVRGAQ